MLILDIRGFSAFAASQDPKDVVAALVSLHAIVVPIIEKHGGIVDKYLGDGMLATFGAARKSDTPAADALNALGEIVEAATRWTDEHSGETGLRLSLNGAVTAGPVIFAALGDTARLEYTVIGEAVNLAAKLEKHNKAEGTAALTTAATLEARHFLFEQMDRQQQALQAYREAASHYQSLSTRLSDEREQLTEARLIEALRFVREGDSPGQPGSMDAEMVRPEPGETTVLTDAYGRVKVRPGDYSLAGLLATESFQLSLRDLHELYRLRDSLGQWQTQLESFDIMLETRAQQREQRIRETRDALDALNADQWLARQAEYRSAIEDALAREDLRFFMTQEQHELADRLAQVEKTLSQLPEDESTRKQRETFQRMNAYFNWRIADDYAVNRWAAEKQLRELDRAMEVFVDQRALIEQEMASGGENQALAARVEARQAALQRLQGELDKALSAARTELLTLVDTELQQQSQEVQGYLRATRHAAARLADTLFLGRNGAAANPATEAGGDRD